MQYFTQGFFNFFSELESNNSTQWFHANKPRYEQEVKQPFLQLITDLIDQIQSSGERLDITAKDCILRVNRDVRFSKDKSSYHLHCTAFISRTGRKDKSIPGLFLRFAKDKIGIMGGCYQPSSQQLTAIRNEIVNKAGEFNQLTQEKEFVARFGKIQGEQAKRLSKEWKEVVEQLPLIANKQFYFSTMQAANVLLQNNLLDELMTYWYASKGVNHFLLQAVRE